MAVNLKPPRRGSLAAVDGVMLGVTAAGVRNPGRKDLMVMRFAAGTRVAGVFTRNRFCAPPVIVAREHLARLVPPAAIRALVVNTGCANAGTGEAGLAAARAVCAELARLLDCDAGEVLPFSTGVIMEPLPVDRIAAALPACIEDLRGENWIGAAEAIMTTDTVPKGVSRRARIDGAEITITGIAKGAGMIHPNMATMLGFIATDARVSLPLLEHAVRHGADRSFNCITVDGDTSTNDSLMLVATGAADMPEIVDAASPQFAQFCDAVTGIAQELAQAIVRDGEGATKFITIVVEAGGSEGECRDVAYAIAHSPLVKTAFFASDPNLGRILAAIGNAGVNDLDVGKVDLYLDDVKVASRGGRHGTYREADGKRVMQQSEITVRVVLNRGAACATVWTCDLTHDYVRINADYRS